MRKSVAIILFIAFWQGAVAQMLNEKEIKQVKGSVLNYGISQQEVLIDENGNEVTFGSISEKITVIDLWATWCKPCVIQSPFFEKRKKQLTNDSVVFISISIEDNFEKWEKYCKEHKVNYKRFWLKRGKESPIYWLTYNEFDMGVRKVWASGVPTFVLLNKQG